MRPLKPVLLFLLAASAGPSLAQTPQWEWGRSGVGEEFDQSSAVTTDPYGFVIATGYFASDSITFGSITLHNNTPGFDDLFIVKYDGAGNVVWAQGAGGDFDDKAYAVTTDASANIYLTGSFYSSTITFGSYTFNNAGSVGDIFVVKYDANGTVLWGTREGGPGLEIPYAIAVDDAASIIVAGRFSSNSVTFGSTTLTQAGSMDVFVVKYDPVGTVLWASGAGGGTNDEAYALAVNASNDIIVAGYFTQEADFGTITLPNTGQANIFLAQCDGVTGTFEWAKAVGSDGDERALAISLDASDNIYASGFFQSDSLIFGATTLYSTTLDNGFMARFDLDGDPVWAHSLNGRSKVYGIAVANNAVYACGAFLNDSLNYGSDVLYAEGSADLFLLKSDMAGNPQWAAKQTSGGESSDFAYAITADAAGNLVMAGGFNSDVIDFGPAQLINSNGFDAFVIKTGDADVGVSEAMTVDAITLFPNPSTGSFTVEGLRDIRSIEIRDALGALVRSLKPSSAQDPVRVDAGSLPPGLYTVHILARERQFTRKLMLMAR